MQERLVMLRKKRKLNQNKISQILHITEQKYGRLERGQFSDSYLRCLLSLADYYGVSIGYLLGLVDEKEDRILAAVRKLSDEQKDLVLEELKQISEH